MQLVARRASMSLEDVYKSYLPPGHKELDCRGFIALCKGARFLDGSFTDNDAAQVFTKAMNLSRRKLDVTRLSDAIRLVATMKGADEQVLVNRLIEAHVERNKRMKKSSSAPTLPPNEQGEVATPPSTPQAATFRIRQSSKPKHQDGAEASSSSFSSKRSASEPKLRRDKGDKERSKSKEKHRSKKAEQDLLNRPLLLPPTTPPAMAADGSRHMLPAAPLPAAPAQERPVSPPSAIEPGSCLPPESPVGGGEIVKRSGECLEASAVWTPNSQSTAFMSFPNTPSCQLPSFPETPCKQDVSMGVDACVDQEQVGDGTAWSSAMQDPPGTPSTPSGPPVPPLKLAGVAEINGENAQPLSNRIGIQLPTTPTKTVKRPQYKSQTRVTSLPAPIDVGDESQREEKFRGPEASSPLTQLPLSPNRSSPARATSVTNLMSSQRSSGRPLSAGGTEQVVSGRYDETAGKSCVEETFKAFCSDGSTEMDNKDFVRLCKKCCLLNIPQFTAQDARFVFSSVVPVSKSRMDFACFQLALEHVAMKRGLDQGLVHRMVSWYEGGDAVPGSPPSTPSASGSTPVGLLGAPEPTLFSVPGESPTGAAKQALSQGSTLPSVAMKTWRRRAPERAAHQGQPEFEPVGLAATRTLQDCAASQVPLEPEHEDGLPEHYPPLQVEQSAGHLGMEAAVPQLGESPMTTPNGLAGVSEVCPSDVAAPDGGTGGPVGSTRPAAPAVPPLDLKEAATPVGGLVNSQQLVDAF